MQSIATSFKPLVIMELRLLLVLFMYWVVGYLVLVRLKNSNEKANIVLGGHYLFLAIPVGFFFINAIALASFRFAQIIRMPEPFKFILLAVLAITLVIIGIFYRTRRERKALYQSLICICSQKMAIISGVVVTLFVGTIPILPLVLDNEVVYFSGFGTDALGYIRVAKSIIEGWYFDPVPPPSDYLLSSQPAKEWVYAMIGARDRPGCYLYVAMTSFVARLNVFQGYLLAGAALLVLMFQYLAFLIGLFDVSPRQRWTLIGISGLLMFSVGFSGNFYHEFLGHVLAVASVIIFAPVLGIVINKMKGAYIPLAIGSCIFTFTVSLFYDLRYAIFGIFCLFLTFLFYASGHERPSHPLKYSLSCLSGTVAGAFVAGSFSFNDLFVQLVPRLFEDIQFSLRTFAYNSGFGEKMGVSVVFLGVLCVIVTVSIISFRSLYRFHAKMAARRFTYLYNTIAVFASSAMIVGLVVLQNDWAAMKSLYILLPACIVQILLYVSFLLSKDTGLKSKQVGWVICLFF